MKYSFKQHFCFKLLFLIVFFGSHTLKSYGQCETCTTTINSNSQASYTVSKGATVCIATGFNYTGTIILNGGTLCNLGAVHDIVFNSGIFENYGTYSTVSGTVLISNAENVVINCYNNASISLNKLTIANIGLLNVNILTESKFYINNTLTVNSVANSNPNQQRVYDVNIIVASKATLNVIGDVNIISGKLQLDNGSNIYKEIGTLSTINFSRQFNVSNSSSLILNNYKNAIFNVTKSISLSSSGIVVISNAGVINTSVDFNISGNGQQIGTVTINNGGTINVTRNFNAASANGSLSVINSGFNTKASSGGLFIGGSYSQNQTNAIFENRGLVAVTRDVNISKGSLVNAGQIFSSRDFLLTNNAVITNNGYIKVARNFSNRVALVLGQKSVIETTNFTNLNQGDITGPLTIDGDSTNYASIVVYKISDNNGNLRNHILFYDQTYVGTSAIRIDDIHNAPQKIGIPFVIFFPPCSFITISLSATPVGVVCKGTSVTLNAQAYASFLWILIPINPVANYSWLPTGGVASGVFNKTYTYTVNSSTTFSVLGVFFRAGGLCTKSQTRLVTVSSLAANAGLPRLIYVGASSLLGGNPSAPVTIGGTTPTATGGVGPYTYLWSAGAIPLTSSNPNATPLVGSTYTVTVTDAVGCTSTSSVAVSVTNPEYAILVKQLDAGVYQSVYNHVYCTTDGEYSNTNLSYTIYNYQRVPVGASSITPASFNRGDNRYDINISALTAGVYVLEVVNEKKEVRYLRFKK